MMWDAHTIGFGPKSAILAALKAKALSVREQRQKGNSVGDAQKSTAKTSMNAGADSPEGSGLYSYLLGDVDSEMFDFDAAGGDWQNWSMLAQHL
jgi:hypothetical protein